MAVTFVTIGEVTLANTEIPTTINAGGAQMLDIKKEVGGKRTIHPLGRDDADIQFEGLIRGATGLFRAQFLDAMRVKGAAIPFYYLNFNYMVVIKDFNYSTQNGQEHPYSITLVVVQDLNQPFPLLLPVAYNDAIAVMQQQALDLASAINDPSVSASMAVLAFTLNSIPSLSNAGSSALATITGPLNSALAATGTSIAEISNGLFG